MKTIKEISELINADNAFINKNLSKITDRKYRSIKKKIEFYEYINKYLNLNPSPEFCASELARLKAQHESIMGNFEYWKKYNAPKDLEPKKFKAKFSAETGLSKVKKQIKTIEFILK